MDDGAVGCGRGDAAVNVLGGNSSIQQALAQE